MKAGVYKFLVTYKGYEKQIWREVEVSSNYPLSKLAYLVLVSFDTLANHLFYIKHNGTHYEIDIYEENEEENHIDPTTVSLGKMTLCPGSVMTMIYDYGCEHEFTITLEKVSPMEKGASIKYPKIVAGQGKGILDNMFPEEFGKVLKEIDKTNQSDQMYFSPAGEYEPWDYRDFDIEMMNKSLKQNIESVRFGFEF
ncbi:MAG: plasmid pRiA4b ORF-3 family protein [Clostridiales bacterium]|nr:plasmid pRiA4b ORF-3 family protein [Clostridiales bacterium]